MADQERPLKERIWEFTKDISVKVSKKAEKHWKINTLRVEIASIKHRINVKYKELGRFVYESFKSGTLEEDSHRAGSGEIMDELARLEGEIADRDKRIELLEQEIEEADDIDPAPVEEEVASSEPETDPKTEDKTEAKKELAE